jgi:uncharacterized protein with PIN domain
VKFLADGMLGKLTRWLRMVGQDVLYSVQLSDSELLDLAKRENRILLTRDFELYKRAILRGTDAFFIGGKKESDQLAEVAKRYGVPLTIDMDKSHCPLCNTKLKPMQKKQLSNEVESNTFAHYDEFWKCPNCGQVYWKGAHWKQINETLTRAQIKVSETR